MTVCAAYVGMGMRRALEVGVRSGVAGRTARVNFLGGSLVKEKYLGFVAASGYMIRAGAVAAFAALVTGLDALGVERRLPVRRSFKTLIEVLMTALACLRTDVPGRRALR